MSLCTASAQIRRWINIPTTSSLAAALSLVDVTGSLDASLTTSTSDSSFSYRFASRSVSENSVWFLRWFPNETAFNNLMGSIADAFARMRFGPALLRLFRARFFLGRGTSNRSSLPRSLSSPALLVPSFRPAPASRLQRSTEDFGGASIGKAALSKRAPNGTALNVLGRGPWPQIHEAPCVIGIHRENCASQPSKTSHNLTGGEPA